MQTAGSEASPRQKTRVGGGRRSRPMHRLASISCGAQHMRLKVPAGCSAHSLRAAIAARFDLSPWHRWSLVDEQGHDVVVDYLGLETGKYRLQVLGYYQHNTQKKTSEVQAVTGDTAITATAPAAKVEVAATTGAGGANKRQRHMLQGPVCSMGNVDGRAVELEFTIHSVTGLLRKDCTVIFPHDVRKEESLLCVPTFQRSVSDLVDWTPGAASEKDRLLQSFYRWCTAVCEELAKQRMWADFIDPCTGYPARSARGGATYNEVDGMQRLLRYKMQQVGQCSILLHPKWGSFCYPASLFSTAPLAALQAACAAADRRLALSRPASLYHKLTDLKGPHTFIIPPQILVQPTANVTADIFTADKIAPTQRFLQRRLCPCTCLVAYKLGNVSTLDRFELDFLRVAQSDSTDDSGPRTVQAVIVTTVAEPRNLEGKY
eukprot:g8422.t1